MTPAVTVGTASLVDGSVSLEDPGIPNDLSQAWIHGTYWEHPHSVVVVHGGGSPGMVACPEWPWGRVEVTDFC